VYRYPNDRLGMTETEFEAYVQDGGQVEAGDPMPEAYRKADLSSAIARELNWVKGQLGQ